MKPTKTREERAAINVANLRKGAATKVRRRGGLTPRQREAIRVQLKSKKPTIWRMPFRRLTRSALRYASNALLAEKNEEGFATFIEPYQVSKIDKDALLRLHTFVQGELLRLGHMSQNYVQKTSRVQLTPGIVDFIVSVSRLPQYPLVFDDEKHIQPEQAPAPAPEPEPEQAPAPAAADKKKKKKKSAAKKE